MHERPFRTAKELMQFLAAQNSLLPNGKTDSYFPPLIIQPLWLGTGMIYQLEILFLCCKAKMNIMKSKVARVLWWP